MSVILKTDTLSNDQFRYIDNLLSLTPVDPKEAMYKQKASFHILPAKPKQLVKFYDHQPEKKELRIPFRVGCLLFGSLMNQDRPHVKYVNDGQPKLNVKLRDEQLPIVQEAYDHLQQYATTTLGVPPGVGKCLDPFTQIIRYNGVVDEVRFLNVGDQLLGDDMSPRTVQSITRGHDLMFQITPKHGKHFICNSVHILTLRSPKPRYYNNHVYEYINGVETFKIFGTNEEASRYYASIATKIDIIDIPLDQFLNFKNISDYRLIHRKATFPHTLTTEDPYTYGTCSSGHIDYEYYYNSEEVRKAVLAGYVDANGKVDLYGIRLRYIPPSLETLIYSLGYLIDRHEVEYMIIADSFRDLPFKKNNSRLIGLRQDTSYQPFTVQELDTGNYFGFTLDGNGRFLLSDYTITHNTIMGATLSWLLTYVTLVYCNRETIMHQWKKTFEKCFPEHSNWVWLVGETPPPTDGGVPPFIICMDERHKLIPEHIIQSIGTLIIDEAHMFCTPTRVSCLLGITPRYIIVESATLERDDGMHMMMQSLAGPHGVFKISNQPYNFYQIETNCTVELTQGNMGINYLALCKSLATFEPRNQLIATIIKNNLHHKFIVLSHLAEHVEILQTVLTSYGITTATLYRKKSTYSDSQVLIGTMPKMGTGFDEENACADFQGIKSDVLILAHSVKKWQQYEQFRGRVMRAQNPTVIWLNDPAKTVRNHLTGLKSWIKTTNGIVHKITDPLNFKF